MKTLLIPLLLLLGFTCSAEDIIVSLARRKLSNPLPGYYISDVILSQKEDSCIGYNNPIGPERYEPVFFSKNIRNELKEFLQRSMPQEPGLLPLVIRVNRIYLYEIIRGVRQYTTVDLSLSFIFPRDIGLEEDFTTSVTHSVYRQDFAATIGQAVIDAVELSFTQYTERKEMGLINPRTITPEQLVENPLYSAASFRCFTEHRPCQGIYHSYFDFRDQLPDTTIRFTVHHRYNDQVSRLNSASLKFPDKKEKEKIWGFCTGDSMYMFNGQAYSLLSREGDQLVTWNRPEDYMQDVIPAAIFGGVVGGMIGAGLLGGFVAASSDHRAVQEFRIDLFDGRLYPSDFPDYTTISSTVIFYLSKSSVRDATLDVYVDGKLLCTMTPGGYFILSRSCHFKEATVVFTTPDGTSTQERIPLELYATDLYLLKVRKNGSVQFTFPNDEIKKDILKRRTPENTLCNDSNVVM